MSDEKQDDGLDRDEKGRYGKGRSGNPGGQPKWIKAFRDAFGERCAPKAEQVLNRVLDRALNTEQLEKVLAHSVQIEDAEGALKCEQALAERYRQGTAAADIALKYVLPKPKTELEVSGPGGSPLVPEAPPHDALTPEQRLGIVLKSIGVLAQHGGLPALCETGGVDSESATGTGGTAGRGGKG